ncbi:MAG: RsmG family class I SAM-dependent methyltransferase [Acidimicrobiia bacterium]
MPDVLDEVLRQAQDLGFFGPRPISEQRAHAEHFVTLALAGVDLDPSLRYLDLGSGGGLPGLVVGLVVPASTGTLLDSRRVRAEFLGEAVDRLGLADRITVVHVRAEDAARDPAHRERYQLVTARSFAAPPVTAESAVAFLAPSGRLVVSEPPEAPPGRWDAAALAELGLTAPTVAHEAGATAAVFQRRGPLDPRWPRKRGIPEKRPLW